MEYKRTNLKEYKIDIEAGLISKILTKEDLFKVIDEQVTVAFFKQHGEIMHSILEHYKNYHIVPGQAEIQEVFPEFEFVDSDQPIEYFVDALKTRRKMTLLNEGVAKVIPLLKDKKSDEAEHALRKYLATIKSEIKVSSDFDIRENTEDRWAKYLKLKDSAGVDGLTTGWEGLDDLTLGYHPGDLVVYIAEPKKGKSWDLIWQSHHEWAVERVPTLFLTREMGPLAIHKRFDAIACKVPWNSFRRGLLTKEEQERFREYLDFVKDKDQNPHTFTVLGYSLENGGATVSSLIPKIETHLMDGGILFVDGLYMMEDDTDDEDGWKALVNIAKGLKSLAQTYNIPIIASTQANIKGKGYIPQMENIAYAKYIAQYADVLISIAQDTKEKIAHLSKIYLLAQREGDVGNFYINFQFDPYIDFSQKTQLVRETEDGDIQREPGL